MTSMGLRCILLAAALLLGCLAGAEAGHLRSLKSGGLGLGLGKGLSLGALLSQSRQQQTSLDVASRISAVTASAARLGKGTIWDSPERRLLLASDTSSTRHLESGGFGGMGKGIRIGFAGTLPARHQVALDAMSSIEAVERGEPGSTPHIHMQRPMSMIEQDPVQGPDRRLQQDGGGGKVSEFSKRTINLANQGTVAATLIRRAAEGRMQVADAITYTRPSRTQDSLALLAQADADVEEASFGRKRLLA